MSREAAFEDLDSKTQAWVGDAVLALFAREWILRQPEISPLERAEVFKALTCNQFLSAFGIPTEVEARIGRVYRRDGLQAAFDYMDEVLLPLFRKQRRNGRRVQPGQRKRRS